MPARSHPERLLRRLEWTVLRRLDGLLLGDHRTLFRGFGLDLADLREYQPWDDVRHIDWNVTARLQVPHVRQFQEDRELCAWFLVDLSASMDFGSGEIDKRALAVEFVAVMARLLTRHGNRVGAMLFTGRIDAVIPPRGGRRQVLQLMQRIAAHPVAQAGQTGQAGQAGQTGQAGQAGQAGQTGRAARPGRARRAAGADRAAQAADGETDLGRLLREAGRMLPRRSLVFLVSDLFSRPGWAQELARLNRRHEVVAVRPVDPLERELPELGLLAVEDAETGERLFIDADDPAFLARFAQAAQRREDELRAGLARAGVDALELATDASLLDTLCAFVEARRYRLRGARGRIAGARPGAGGGPGGGRGGGAGIGTGSRDAGDGAAAGGSERGGTGNRGTTGGKADELRMA